MSDQTTSALTAKQQRRIVLIVLAGVVAAVILWVGEPKAPDMEPRDFASDGAKALEFCDPLRPRFLPVVDRQSPVVMVQMEPSLFFLKTATGKPLGPFNLVDKRMRFFAVDAAGRRFAAVDPTAGRDEGQWVAHIPLGMVRVFADFTPAVTGREMYAATDLPFGTDPSDAASAAPVFPDDLTLGTEPVIAARHGTDIQVKAAGTITAAELAAFDVHASGPNGFMVHPADVIAKNPAGTEAHFQVIFPDPGKYVLWARVRIGGEWQQVRDEITVEP